MPHAGSSTRTAHKPGVELPHDGGGAGRVAILGQAKRGRLRTLPVLAQRVHDSGADQALHEGARREVRAQLAARPGVQRVLQQGAEDRRLHVGPVALSSGEQQLDLVRAEAQRLRRAVHARREQPAVEPAHVAADGRGEAAGVHGAPQLADQAHERGRRRVAIREQPREAIRIRQQSHGLGEHAEDRPHKECRHVLGRVPGLQHHGQLGQQCSDLARDLHPAARRVERVGISPDGAEALAQRRVTQVGQVDAEAGRVGELAVVLAQAGEVRIEVEAEADVADDQEGRVAFRRRHVPCVAFGLTAGAQHVLGPAAGVADGGAPVRLAAEQRGLGGRVGLLGFQDEAATLVEVDEARAEPAVRLRMGNAAFESVWPEVAGLPGWARYAEQIAQFQQERRRVGSFGPAGRIPADDERLDGGCFEESGMGSVVRHGRTTLTYKCTLCCKICCVTVFFMSPPSPPGTLPG